MRHLLTIQVHASFCDSEAGWMAHVEVDNVPNDYSIGNEYWYLINAFIGQRNDVELCWVHSYQLLFVNLVCFT